MSDPLTFDQAVARAMSGGIVWDDELPESMRGFGVPSLLRYGPPRSERARCGAAPAPAGAARRAPSGRGVGKPAPARSTTSASSTTTDSSVMSDERRGGPQQRRVRALLPGVHGARRTRRARRIRGDGMSLTEFPDVIQGTDEWHDQRRGIVTASVVGRLLTSTRKIASNDTSRGLLMTLVAERITGWTDPVFVSDDMLRGHDDEPRAVAAYAESTDTDVRHLGFMVRDDWGFRIGYSPDGLVGDDGLIEVKSRRAKKQLQTILDDEVPAENMAQLQCGLLVSGRAWCDYVSYCGGMPLYVKRVEPDPEWFEVIVAAVTSFELAASLMTEQYEAATVGLPITERTVELEMVI